jgi:hypothetical protein
VKALLYLFYLTVLTIVVTPWAQAKDTLSACEQGLIATAAPIGIQTLRLKAEAAAAKLDPMEIAVLQLPLERRELGLQLFAAAQVTLTEYHSIYVRSDGTQSLDVGRHMAILDAISRFDEDKAERSLFRLKRTIEGRYDLAEYIRAE